ncbi:MAG: hypothetical protein CMH49_08050 [Myxococcales bacterium]|nr:hypothetical protein [Myxococcales bacterium]
MTPRFVLRTLVVIFLIGSAVFSACLDSPSEEFLPPYQEEYSSDGGMYVPKSPETSSSYGSGSGSGSGSSAYASGASEKSEFDDSADQNQKQAGLEFDQGLAEEIDGELLDATVD